MPNDLQALVGLLTTLFESTGEMRRFVRVCELGPDLHIHLPGEGSLAELAFAVAELFGGRGLVTRELFQALARERPVRVAELVEVAVRVAGLSVTDVREIIEVAAKTAPTMARPIATNLQALAPRLPHPLRDEVVLASQQLLSQLRRAGDAGAPDPLVLPKPLAPTTPDMFEREIQASVARDQLPRAAQRLQDLARHVDGSRGEYEVVQKLTRVNDEERPRRLLELSRAVLEQPRPGSSEPPPTGRVAAVRGAPAEPEDPRVFLLDRIIKRYQSGKAPPFTLQCEQLSALPGHVVGVAGPNGSGKSTLLRIIAARLAADEGTVSHPGLADPSRPTPDWQALRRAIYFVPQRLEPWSGAIADELHLHLARCGVRGGENERRVTNALLSLGLAEVREKPWHHLSGGFQLRVELARAILSPVRLLVLDEPLASLDAPAMVEILAFLRDLAADPKTRLTVVLTSHHLHEVESICSFMVALDAKGRAKPYTTRGACLEVSGDFPAELYEHLYARGCTWRTSSRREATSLIEHDTAEIPELWRIFLEAYGLYGGEIVNLRDVSRSLARIGAEL